MNRRDFFSRSGLFGFTLAIDARHFEAELAGHSRSVRGTVRDRVAEIGNEPGMIRASREVDLLVCGGGMSGVCAAIAAARNGAKTLLVQDRSRLGGNASSEIKMHIVGADMHGSRSGWREGGLIEEIRLEDAARNPHRSWELFDLLLYDLCMREENLELLLDTSIYAATTEEGKITTAYCRCDKTETIYEVKPKLCVDATGDGRLAFECGAEFREGREPRSMYDEPLALEEGDDQSQGCSILFTAKKHDRPIPFTPPSWARKITENDLLFRKIPHGFL